MPGLKLKYSNFLLDHFFESEGLTPKKAEKYLRSTNDFETKTLMNLASFVSTEMEEEAHRVMVEAMQKNFIDKTIYTETENVEENCVATLLKLYHGDPEKGYGVATIGSSEAIFLCGLVMKAAWNKWAKKNKVKVTKPKLVVASHVQICWKKFGVYFDVDLVIVPTDKDGRFDTTLLKDVLTPDVIGVVGVLGSTYNGVYDDIEGIVEVTKKYNRANKTAIMVHVDAASGGFVAPFLEEQKNLKWDFALDGVSSINVSGHKYGLVYPGIGWALWKDAEVIDPKLVFSVSYLGGNQPDFGLNFSRSSAQLMGQYYNFLRYAFKGYQEKMTSILKKKNKLEEFITGLKGSRNRPVFAITGGTTGLPLLCFSVTDAFKENLCLKHFVNKMHEQGWSIPLYPMPEGPLEGQYVLRIVIRVGFDRIHFMKLQDDIQSSLEDSWKNPASYRSLKGDISC